MAVRDDRSPRVADARPIPRARLTGATVLVSGAAGGIGRATCDRLLLEGAHVVALDIDDVGLVALRDAAGPAARLAVVEVDATSSAGVRQAVEDATSGGALHGVVSVAGGSGRGAGDGPVHACTDDGWAWTLEANLTSHFVLVRAALPALLRADGAAVVLVGSVLGSTGGGRHFATHAYAAAKAGVAGLARAMASYYAADGLRVNVVAPGLVDTPMSRRAQEDSTVMGDVAARQPLGGMASPEAVAGTIVHLLSDDAAHTTGATIPVDGGWLIR
jgi:meso-butanediol dehydrogenase/(S,S)-butanediol dehydrogenase/diacetyl reductase